MHMQVGIVSCDEVALPGRAGPGPHVVFGAVA